MFELTPLPAVRSIHVEKGLVPCWTEEALSLNCASAASQRLSRCRGRPASGPWKMRLYGRTGIVCCSRALTALPQQSEQYESLPVDLTQTGVCVRSFATSQVAGTVTAFDMKG